MLTINEIFKIIAGEAKNSCTTEAATIEYFSRYYSAKVDMGVIRTIAHIIDFNGLREVQQKAYNLFPLFE